MNERQTRVLARIDPTRTAGLEIGPLDRPLVTREMGPIAYVDRATTAQLRQHYEGDPGVNADQIVDVDFVHGNRPLVETVGRADFDYVVASHTVEHVPDVVGWLRQVAGVLRVGGILSLVIPDKRFTFDYLRPTSSPSEMVDAHFWTSSRPTFRQVFEGLAVSVDLDLDKAWSGSLDIRELAFRHTEEAALNFARRAMEGEYVDAHCWVFTPQSFFDALRFFIRMDLFDYRVVSFIDTPRAELEFYVALEKLPPTSDQIRRQSDQLASIPVQEQPERRNRVLPHLGLDDTEGLQVVCAERDEAREELEIALAELAEERRFVLRRWAIEHPWSDRLRPALPQRWGLLDRAMKDRW